MAAPICEMPYAQSVSPEASPSVSGAARKTPSFPAGSKGERSGKLNGGKLFGKAEDPAGISVHDFLQHFRSEGQAPVEGNLLLEVHKRRGAREDDFVADDGVGRFDILFGEGLLLVFGDIEIDVGVALHDHDGFAHVRVAAVADDDFQIREVAGHAVDVADSGVFHDGAAHEGGRAGGDDDRNTELAALGVDGIETAVIRGDACEVGIDGRASESVALNPVLQFGDGVHALDGVNAGEADEPVRILLHEFEDAGIGRFEAVGGFGIAADDYAFHHILGFHLLHDLLNGLGLRTVFVVEVLEHGAERASLGEHASDGIGSAGTETEVDNFHGIFLALCAVLEKSRERKGHLLFPGEEIPRGKTGQFCCRMKSEKTVCRSGMSKKYAMKRAEYGPGKGRKRHTVTRGKNAVSGGAHSAPGGTDAPLAGVSVPGLFVRGDIVSFCYFK